MTDGFHWRLVFLALLALNVGAAFMFLLSEKPVVDDGDEMPTLDPAIPHVELVRETGAETIGSNGPHCYTIGPLPTLLAQQRAEDRLRPFVTDLRLRQTRADHDRGWWVYLPAASRSEALQLTRQLAEQAVEDYYVIAGGDLANAVSVGLYQNLDNARRRQAAIRALGFDAQLEVRRESIPQFWIDYRQANEQEPPWRFIVRASPGAQRIAIPCFTALDADD